MLAVVVLLGIAALLACNTSYSPAYDGLVLVPSFGSATVQDFSFDLTNGHISTLSSAPAILGQPTAMALDPSGTFAYVTVVPNAQVFQTLPVSSIATYAIAADGTLSATGTPVTMVTLPGGNVFPVAMTIDSAGKFLFVADQQTTDTLGNAVPGTISVFSVASGTLTEVAGSPFQVPVLQSGPTMIANLVGLALTPTKYPTLNTQAVANAACALWQPLPPSTPEYLYVTDSNNNVVWAFNVASSGSLSLITNQTGTVVSFPADSVTTGVAVDPCNRFVFVTNTLSNDLSAYAICNSTSPGRPAVCDSSQYPEGSLVQVPGSPFALGAGGGAPNGPTVLAVDPLANFLYVVDHTSNQLSCFRISGVNGSLAPLTTAFVGTGINPFAIAIRADDNWVFVANNNTTNGTGSLNQYELSPATGVLTPFGGAIETGNYPTAVVVK